MRWLPVYLIAALCMLAAAPAQAVVWEWSTNGNFEGWGGWNHVTNTSVSGGSMNGTITGGDPFVYSPGSLALSGSSNTWFKVYITYSPGAGTATPFQVFYNRGAGINEPDSFHFTVHPGTELYQVHVPRKIAEQGKTNNWTGNTISQIRFDLGNHSSGTFNIHWVAIENFPIPDWDFNITPAGGAAHASGWAVANQLSNWQVTNDRKLQFNVTGGDPHLLVDPLAFDPATFRYVYMRHEVAGYSNDNPDTGETFSFPGTGSAFVYKNWRYYPNVGYETIVLDMLTRTSNSSWNGAYGSISTFRIDPATSNTSGTHRYDRIGIFTTDFFDGGARTWTGMSGAGTWIAPKHGSYAGSTVNIAGGMATLSRTGSNPFGAMNIDFAVAPANRYLYLDVEPVTSAPRYDVAMTVQWRADGEDFAAQNRQRRYTNLTGGRGANRYVVDLGAAQAFPYNGAWVTSAYPHGLLLHFDHATDLSAVRIVNAGLVSTAPHTVTASAGANGAIAPAGNVLVLPNNDAKFYIVPNPGYRVAEILVDGAQVSPVLNADLSYTIANVTSNRSIAVSFAPADWPFTTNGYTDGWSVMNQIQPGWTVSGGILAYDITDTATDPMWASQWMNLPASQFDWLMVRARNGTRSTGSILFWDDDTIGNFTGGYQANYPINANDPEFSTYWVNLRARPLWQAATTIQRLRFDFPDSPLPPQGQGTRVEVDRILLSASGPPVPTVQSIVRLDPTPTNAGSVQFEARFSHTMSTLTTSDFTLAATGTATGNIAPLEILGPTRARVTVNTLAGSGTLGLNFVPNQTARDVANQPVAAGFTGEVYTIDTEAPTPVCRNITAYLNSGGSVTIEAGDIDGGSTDFFGITSRTINGGASVTFNCADLGDHTVTLGLQDALGNTSSCQATVTVVDKAVNGPTPLNPAPILSYTPIAFSVSVLSGADDWFTPPYAYQWQFSTDNVNWGATFRDGTPIADGPQTASRPGRNPDINPLVDPVNAFLVDVPYTVSGATGPSLAIDHALAGVHNGYYRCVVTDMEARALSYGCGANSATLLSINEQLVILREPQGGQYYEGNNESIDIVVFGGSNPQANYVYNWRLDGTPIDNSNLNPYTFVADPNPPTPSGLGWISTTGSPGSYRVVVSDATIGAGGVKQSATATVQVQPAVTVTLPAAVIRNATETFSVTANVSGGYPASGGVYTYAWNWNSQVLVNGPHPSGSGAVVSGATTATLTITGLGKDDDGTYQVVVNDSKAPCPDHGNKCRGSASTALTVTNNILVSSAPEGADIYAGDTVDFEVGVVAGDPATYEFDWKWDFGAGEITLPAPGTHPSGSGALLSEQLVSADTHRLTVTGAGIGDNGDYYCIIRDANPLNAEAASAAGTLTVWPPLQITAQPQPLKRYTGQAASFAVQATGGIGNARTFQWEVNTGSGWTPQSNGGNVSGATTATLTLSPVNAANDGAQYRCRVTAPASDVTSPNSNREQFSGVATLAVSSPLAVLSSPANVTAYITDPAFTLEALFEGGMPFSAPPEYQTNWRRTGVNPVSPEAPAGAGVLTLGTPNAASLQLIPGALGAGVYDFHVNLTDQVQTTASGKARVTVVNLLNFDQPLRSAAVRDGDRFSWTVEVSGGIPPLTYQWQKQVDDGAKALVWVDVPDDATHNGVDTDTLVFTNVTFDDAGTYLVVVSDSGTEQITSSAQLVVEEALPVGGGIGLALTALLTALGGAAALRRRK